MKKKLTIFILLFLLLGSSGTGAFLLTYENSAPKTYEATFYNENTIVATVETEFDKAVSAPEDPTKTGHEFKGWFEDQTFVVPFNEKKAYNKDVSFYASWQKKEQNSDEPLPPSQQPSVSTYKVKFFDVETGEQIGETQNVKAGEGAAAPVVPEKYGYVFDKWSRDFDNITKNTEIFAYYKPGLFDVVFIYGVESEKNVTVSDVEFLSVISDPAFNDLQEEDWVFDGWYFDVNSNNKYDENDTKAVVGSSVLETEGTTLVAKYKRAPIKGMSIMATGDVEFIDSIYYSTYGKEFNLQPQFVKEEGEYSYTYLWSITRFVDGVQKGDVVNFTNQKIAFTAEDKPEEKIVSLEEKVEEDIGCNYSTKAGDYQITLKITQLDANGNFVTEGTQVYELTIDKAKVTLTVPNGYRTYGDGDDTIKYVDGDAFGIYDQESQDFRDFIKIKGILTKDRIFFIKNKSKLRISTNTNEFSNWTKDKNLYDYLITVKNFEKCFDMENYSVNVQPGKLRINQRSVNFVIDNKTVVYGYELVAPTAKIADGFTYAGSETEKPHTLADVISLAWDGNKNAGSYKITAKLKNNNYKIAGEMPTAIYKITPRVIEVVLKEQKNVYNGTEIFDIKETSQFYEIKTADNQSHEFDQNKIIAITKQIAGSDVGKYALTATIVNNNYTFEDGKTFVQADAFEVLRREIQVNATDKTNVYNKGVHTYTYNSNIELGEETTHTISFTYTTSGADVGNYALNSTFNGEDFAQSASSKIVVSGLSFSDGTNNVKASNYSIVYNLSADITPADLKVEATKLSTEYNAQAQYPALSILGVDDCNEQNFAKISYSNNKASWSTESEFAASEFAMKNAGVYKVYVKVVVPNYKEFVTEQQIFTITKAPLSVKVNDISVTYGDTIGLDKYTFEYTSAFKGQDNASNSVIVPENKKSYLTFSQEHSAKTSAGTKIYVDLDVNRTDKIYAPNYEISVTKGTVTVEQRTVTVTFKNLEGFYGSSSRVAIDSVANLPTESTGDTISSLGLTWSISQDGKEFTAESFVGQYDIKVKEVKNTNYIVEIDKTTNLYNVKQLAITGTVSGSSEFNGEKHLLNAYDVFKNDQSIINGHQVSGVITTGNSFAGIYKAEDGKFDYSKVVITDKKGQDVTSNYAISLTGSYQITNANFKAPSIMVDDVLVSNPENGWSFEYNGKEYTVTVVPSEVAGGETAEVMYSADGLNYSKDSIKIKNAGIYEIYYKIKAANHEEYQPQQSFDIEVKQKQLTIGLEPFDSVVYGQACPEFKFDYSGFIDGENESVLSREPIITCEYVAGTDVKEGGYPITISGAEALNYKIEYAKGKVLTVLKKELVLAGFVKFDNVVYDAQEHYAVITSDELNKLSSEGSITIEYSVDGVNYSSEKIAFRNVVKDQTLFVRIKESTNYKGTTTNIKVSIAPKQLTASFVETKAQVIDFGGQNNINLNVKIDGFHGNEGAGILNSVTYFVSYNNDTVAYPYDHSYVLNASATPYVFTISGAQVENYTIDYTSAKTNVTVDKQQLVASIATTGESYYGDLASTVIANHKIVYTYNGTNVDSPEGIQLALQTHYEQGDNANYEYEISFASQGTRESTNYKVIEEKSKSFYLNARVGTVTVASATQSYGVQSSDDYAVSVEFANGFVQPQGMEAGVIATIEKQSARMFALRNSSANGNSYGVGNYSINVTYTNANYVLTLISKDSEGNVIGKSKPLVALESVQSASQLKVTPKTITIQIDNTTSIYGQDTGLDGAFSIIEMLPYGDQKEDLQFELKMSGESRGEYAVSAQYNNENYIVNVVNKSNPSKTVTINSGETAQDVAIHEIKQQKINFSVSTDSTENTYIYGQYPAFNLASDVELLEVLKGTLTISKDGMEDVVIDLSTDVKDVFNCTALLSVGVYNVAINFADTTNYDVVDLAGTTFQVKPREVNVHVTGTKIYNANNIFNTFASVSIVATDNNDLADELSVTGVVVATGKDASKNAYGVESSSLELTGNNCENYTIVGVSGELTITARTIKIAVSGNSIVYGDVNAEQMSSQLTAVYKLGDGFVSGDNINSLNIKFAVDIADAAKTEGYANVGSYDIKIASWNNTNYKVDFVESQMFAVQQRQVEITAFQSTTSIFGQQPTQLDANKFTVTTANLDNTTILSQAISSISYTLKDELTALSDAGYYDVVATLNNGNFKFVVNGADANQSVIAKAYQIKQKPITIDLTQTVVYNGEKTRQFIIEKDSSDVDLGFTLTINATTSSANVGAYVYATDQNEVTISTVEISSGHKVGNYAISYVGTITVDPCQVSIVKNANASLTNVYGSDVMSAEQIKAQYTINKVSQIDLNSDATSALNNALVFSIDNLPEQGYVSVGKYNVSVALVDNNFVFQNGFAFNGNNVDELAYEITQKSLIITINKSVLYDEENNYSYDSQNDLQYVATGLLGDHVSIVQFALEQNVGAGRYVYNGENSNKFASFSVVVNDKNGISVKGNYQLQLDIVYIVSEIDFKINNEVGKTEFEYDGMAHKAIPVTINGNAEDYEITYQWGEGEYTSQAPEFTDVITTRVKFRIVKISDGVWTEDSVTVKVVPRRITVSLNNEKTYGDELSTTISSADRLVDGHSISVIVTPSKSIVKYENNVVVAYVYDTTGATPVTDGFETPVATITNANADPRVLSNYEIVYNLATKIVPKAIDVNVIAQSKVYGDANDENLATATWDASLDLVASDIKFERVDSENVNVGDYLITATNTNKNYKVINFVWANNDQTYSITPRQITVEKSTVTKTTYGETIATPVADSFAVSAGDVNENIVNEAKSSLNFIAVDSSLNALTNKSVVDTYNVKVTLNSSNFMFAENADYLVVEGAYQITKATLTVKVNASRAFIEGSGSIGLSNITDYEVNGWVDGQVGEVYNSIKDLIAVSEINTGVVYTKGTHEGKVQAIISNEYSDETSFKNYILRVANGDLTITPKSVTINLSTATYYNIYDGTNTREISTTKDSSGTDLDFTLTATATLESANADTYSIDNGDISNISLSGNSYSQENYDFGFDGSITIIPRDITVSLNASSLNASRDYNGQPYQTTIESADKLAANDTISITVTAGTDATTYFGIGLATDNVVGDFTITSIEIKDENDEDIIGNYAITYDLTAIITKQQLTATIVANDNEAVHYYGDEAQDIIQGYSIVYSYKGETVVKPDGIELGISTKYQKGNKVGEYPLTFVKTNTEVTNYKVTTFVEKEFSINQRALTVNVSDSGHTYGQNDSYLPSTISYEGQGTLPDPQITLSIVSQETSTFAMRSAEPRPAGSYAISVYYTNANYLITFIGQIGETSIKKQIEATTNLAEIKSLSVAEYVIAQATIIAGFANTAENNVVYGTKPDLTLSYTGIAEGEESTVKGQITTTFLCEGQEYTANELLGVKYGGYKFTIDTINVDNDNYIIKVIEQNTETQFAQSTITITPATIKAGFANTAENNVVYGTKPDLTLSYTGIVESNKTAIEQQITASFLVDNDEYNSTILLGVKDGGYKFTIDTISIANDNYTIKVVEQNTETQFVQSTITINKKPVAIALNASTVYAGADQNVHQLTFTKDSSNVDLGFTLSITAQTTSGDAGQYYYIEGSDVNNDGDGVVIINSETISDGEINNYKFNYSGSITIKAQEIKLSVTVDDVTYGQRPKFNFNVFETIDEQDVAYTLLNELSGTITISKDGMQDVVISNIISNTAESLEWKYNELLSVGDYKVTLNFADTKNYTIEDTFKTSFNVAQREVNVYLAGSKTYDGNGEFKSFNSEVIDKESNEIISGLSAIGTVVAVGKDANVDANGNKIENAYGVESYTFALTGNNSANYTIVGVDGEFTIKPATIKAGFANATENINYGAKPTLTLYYSGIVESERSTVETQITTTLLCNREVYTATLLGVRDGGYTFTIDPSTISVNNSNYTIEAVQESAQKPFAKSVVTINKLEVTVEIDPANKPTSIYGETLLPGDIQAKVAAKAIIRFNTNNMSAETATIIENEIKAAIKYSVDINNQSPAGDYDISISLDDTNYVLKTDTIEQGYVIEGISIIVKVHGEKIYDATQHFAYDKLQIISAVNAKTGETITEELSFDENSGSVSVDSADVATNADFSNALGIENLDLTTSKYKVAGFSADSDYTITPLVIKLVYDNVAKDYDGGYSATKTLEELGSFTAYTQEGISNTVWKELGTVPNWDNIKGTNITIFFNKIEACATAYEATDGPENGAVMDTDAYRMLIDFEEGKTNVTNALGQNYYLDIGVKRLTINKATIKITADDVVSDKEYNGSEVHQIVNRGTGVTGQTVSFTATTNGSDVKAGGYVANGAIDDLSTIANGCEVGELIISDLSISGGDLSNYQISFIDFAITISPKAVSVTFNGAGHPFGMNPMDSGEIKETATINGDVDDKARESISFSPVADKTSVVGSYNITASINNNPNFTFVAEDGSYSQTATFKNAYVVSKATAYIVGKNWSDNTTNVYNLAEMDYGTNIFDAIGLVYQTVDANGNAIYAMATADQLAKEIDTSTGEAKEGAGFYYNNDVIDVSVGSSYYVTFNGQFFANFNVKEAANIYLKVKTVAVGGLNGKLYTFEDALNTAASGEIFVKYPTQTADSSIASVLYPETDKNGDGTNDYTTIKSGVTLNLPRDEDGNVGYYKNGNIVDCQGYEKTADADEAANRNVYLLLNKGYILNNNGNINIGGLLGAGGAGKPNGITVGKYAEITMGNGSQIINNNGSVLSVYGYIKEESSANQSSIIINDGATIWAPFTVYDFRGGSNTYAAATKNIVPFFVYDVSNVHPLLTVNYGGSFRVWADLYAGEKHNTTDKGYMVAKANTVSALFMLEEGATVSFKYNSNQGKVQVGYNENAGHTDINLTGNTSIGSMQLTINIGFNYTVDTKDFYFGVSYKHHINIQKGVLTVPSGIKIKLLPGSEITVGKGAEIYVKGSVTAYSSYTDKFPGLGTTKYYTADGNDYAGVVPAGAVAKITVNGTFRVSGSFGGQLYTTNTTKDEAKIIFESGAKTSVTTSEVIATSGISFLTNATTTSKTETAKANIGGIEQELTKPTYNGVGDGSFWSPDVEIGITFSNGAVSKTVNVPQSSTALGEGQPKQIIDYFASQGYTLTEDALNAALSAKLAELEEELGQNGFYANTTITVSKQPIVYNVTFKYVVDGAEPVDSTEIVSDSGNAGTFNVDANTMPITLAKANIANNEYQFVGWFADATCTQQITQISELKDITLYAKIMPNDTYTIIYQKYDNNSLVENNRVTVEGTSQAGFAGYVIDAPDLSGLIDNFASDQYFPANGTWNGYANGTTLKKEDLEKLDSDGDLTITLTPSLAYKNIVYHYKNTDGSEVIYYQQADDLTTTGLQSYASTTGYNTVWFNTSTCNTATYFIGGAVGEVDQIHNINSLVVDGFVHLYGEDYFIVTNEILGGVDESSGKYADDAYAGGHDNVLLYNINLSALTADITNISGLPTEVQVTVGKNTYEDANQTKDGSTTKSADGREITYAGQFVGKDIVKLIIGSECLNSIEAYRVIRVQDYTTQECNGLNNVDVTYYDYYHVGVFSHNAKMSQVIFAKDVSVENCAFSNVEINGNKLNAVGKTLTDNNKMNDKEGKISEDPTFGGIIKTYNGGPGDGFWFILLPAFALLLAGGYLSFNGNKKQTN